MGGRMAGCREEMAERPAAAASRDVAASGHSRGSVRRLTQVLWAWRADYGECGERGVV